MSMDYYTVAYSGWQPVRINLGSGGSDAGSHGFSVNSTGLQWNSVAGSEYTGNQFDGWVVCDWWHGKQQFRVNTMTNDQSLTIFTGVPQLFFRLAGYNTPLPKSCADIHLKPEYVET